MHVLRFVIVFLTWARMRVARGPLSLITPVHFHGWIFRHSLPRFQLVLASSRGAVQRVLARGHDFPKGRVAAVLLEPLIGQGLFAAAEADAAIRRMFVRAIAQVDDRTIVATCERLLDDYRLRWERTHVLRRLPVSAEMSRLTIDIVSECLFRVHFTALESAKFTELFVRYQRVSNPMRLYPWATRRVFAPLRVLRQRRIATLMRDLIRGRFVSALRKPSSPAASSPFALAVAERERAGEYPLSDERLLDEVAVMLLAGHETSASALSWLLRELANDPQLQRRLREDSGASPAPVSAGADSSLLRSVISEALRLYPPIPLLPRDATCPHKIDGVHIRKGALVFVSPWVIHRHTQLWDEPDTFRAERFQSLTAADTATRFLPFGLGPRACPGSRFAMVEMQALVSGVVQKFDLRLIPGPAVKPLGNMTLRPDREIYLGLDPV